MVVISLVKHHLFGKSRQRTEGDEPLRASRIQAVHRIQDSKCNSNAVAAERTELGNLECMSDRQYSSLCFFGGVSKIQYA